MKYRIYAKDIKADAEALIAWIHDFESRTGQHVGTGNDSGRYFIDIDDPRESGADAVFAKLRFG